MLPVATKYLYMLSLSAVSNLNNNYSLITYYSKNVKPIFNLSKSVSTVDFNFLIPEMDKVTTAVFV